MSIDLRVLVVILAFAGPVAAQDELPAELREALVDLQSRDPATHEELSRTMAKSPVEARRRLVEHARYLERLRRTKANRPAQHVMLRRQEEMERGVRSMQERYHALPEDSPERERLRQSMRGVLSKWFDLRNEIRRVEIEVQQVELKRLQAERERSGADRDAAHREWLKRIVDGGADAMRARMKDLATDTSIMSLAPHAVRIVLEHDPENGRKLARLAEQDRKLFVETMRRLFEEHPLLKTKAAEAVRGQEKIEFALRSAVRKAHGAVLPYLGKDGRLALSKSQLEKLRVVLDDVLEAERAVAAAQIRHAERMLVARERMLLQRAKRKDVIVDLQLARLTGRGELYEW